MKSSEIVETAKELNIRVVDRFALKRARDKLGEKKNFIDPQELAIINSIDLKLTSFQDKANNLNITQKNIENEKQRIQLEINTTFTTLTKALNERKTKLLEKLDEIVNKTNEEIKKRENDVNQSLDSIKKHKHDTDNLMDTAIALNELKDRKLKIQQHEQEIIKIIQQSNEQHTAQINKKIRFTLDATATLQVKLS